MSTKTPMDRILSVFADGEPVISSARTKLLGHEGLGLIGVIVDPTIAGMPDKALLCGAGLFLFLANH